MDNNTSIKTIGEIAVDMEDTINSMDYSRDITGNTIDGKITVVNYNVSASKDNNLIKDTISDATTLTNNSIARNLKESSTSLYPTTTIDNSISNEQLNAIMTFEYEEMKMGPSMLMPLSNENNEIIGMVSISRLKLIEATSYNSLIKDIECNIFSNEEIKSVVEIQKQVKEGFKKRQEKLQFIKMSTMAKEWMQYSHNMEAEFFLVERFMDNTFEIYKYQTTSNSMLLNNNNTVMDPMKDKDLYLAVNESREIKTKEYDIYPFYDHSNMVFGLFRMAIKEEIDDGSQDDINKVVNALKTAVLVYRNEQKGIKLEPILQGELLNEQSHSDYLFARFLLTDLRQLLLTLDTASIAEIKSYKNPPIVVLQVMQCVLYLFGKRPSDIYTWSTVVKFINFELLKKMAQFDPTAAIKEVYFKRVEETIKSNNN